MVPIEQCRGIESTDCNDQFVMVRAPIQIVAPAFTQIRQATFWEQDVYDREIEIVGQDFIVFQFRGHLWTLIHHLAGLKATPNEQDAEAIARQLNTDVIYYKNSDTGGYIRYQLYDKAGLAESLSFEQGNQPCQFQSNRRQVSTEAIGFPAIFISRFMREQDAYVPLLFLPRRAVGQRLVLKFEALIDPRIRPVVPGPIPLTTLERSDFEQCDRIAIKS